MIIYSDDDDDDDCGDDDCDDDLSATVCYKYFDSCLLRPDDVLHYWKLN